MLEQAESAPVRRGSPGGRSNAPRSFDCPCCWGLCNNPGRLPIYGWPSRAATKLRDGRLVVRVGETSRIHGKRMSPQSVQLWLKELPLSCHRLALAPWRRPCLLFTTRRHSSPGTSSSAACLTTFRSVAMRKLLAALALTLLAACSDSDPAKAPSTETDPSPQVDTDPTPQTGTGGPSQSASPDATTNGAPGAAPMANQPTATD